MSETIPEMNKIGIRKKPTINEIKPHISPGEIEHSKRDKNDSWGKSGKKRKTTQSKDRLSKIDPFNHHFVFLVFANLETSLVIK